MPDVFLSYSHADNRLSDNNTHEFTDAINHFRGVLREVRGNKARRDDDTFFDIESIRDGDDISATTTQAARDCHVMIAFCSPNYFASDGCRAEWLAFDDERRNGRRRQKLLIPVEVRPAGEVRFDAHVDEDGERWLRELTSSNGLRRNVTSEILLSRDTAPLYAAMEQLEKRINEYLDDARGATRGGAGDGNYIVVRAPIRDSTLDDEAIQRYLARTRRLKWTQIDPVCIVYAGGTVGMVHQQDSDELHADYEMAAGIDTIVAHLRAKLVRLPFNMHFFSLAQTIDSSNITARNWVDLATLIQEQMNEYQGFVILHGTNTLAYTASALSFLLRDSITRPVILTGAEVPLSVSNTDAIHNVEHAIRAAAHQAYNGPNLIPEVCVYWNNHLYRGNRVTKKFASDRTSSFHTPNMPVPLATLANDKLDLDYEHIRRMPADTAEQQQHPDPVIDIARPRVDVLFIHPDMDFSDLDARFPSDTLDGLILLTYGPGNAPEDLEFLRMIERLLNEGTVIVNVTQCPYGRVELKLFETAATLFDLGVVDGYDMTLETAYTKLLWAIAARGNRKQPGVNDMIRTDFQRCLAGEMSASVHTIPLGGSRTFHRHGDYLISDIPQVAIDFERHEITEVFLRIERLKLARDTRSVTVRVLFGQPPDQAAPEWSGNVLAEFTKSVTQAERDAGTISKNLEVTHPFRKAFRNERFGVSLTVDGLEQVEFASFSAVVYTTANWGRGT